VWYAGKSGAKINVSKLKGVPRNVQGKVSKSICLFGRKENQAYQHTIGR